MKKSNKNTKISKPVFLSEPNKKSKPVQISDYF